MKEMITSNASFNYTVNHYLNTKHFASLARNTQVNYEYSLKVICKTKVFGKELGIIRLSKFNVPLCTEIYDTWEADVSTERANQLARIFSVVINYCISLELLFHNPMGKVKKRSNEPRSVIWTDEQVELFLDTAFTNFKWRNIGLLVLMCYEWGQRPVDIRNLKWEQINLEGRKVTITQTKRGVTVELPIPNNIFNMLSEQKGDWDFQHYVVPSQKPSEVGYRPLTMQQVSLLANQVKAHCELPPELCVGDLRKTAIVQMIEGEVDHLAIMSVTGHKNVSSLNPYNKFNFKTAKSALERRAK